ncbi:Pex12 amino terminal region-domain-containing protein [Pyronema omphalodes]|nr:Pex12 amino terminal region-domain-containing protein [Pyronema omphalodes]
MATSAPSTSRLATSISNTSTSLVTTGSSTDWTAATRAAQERVIALQAERAREATNGIDRVKSFLNGGVDRPAFRVGQLDTELLDEELLELLKGQLWGGLKYFRPSIKENYEPELLLLLRAALFKLTIWDHNATYGAALQNLRYTDARHTGPLDVPPSRGQKSLYGLVTVGGRYLYQRLNLYLLNNSHSSSNITTRLSRLVDLAGSLHSALTLVSFTAFLVTGHYRTLLDRVLKMRLVTPTRTVSREVSFEYLNRQLVWHAFTEFLLFILPLLKIGRWRRWWARFLRRVRSENGSAGSENIGELAFLPERTCAICYKESDAGAVGGQRATDITNPYETQECGHVYCYVCLAGKIELEEGEGWTCLRCAGTVKRCRPWRGGVEGLTGVGDWGEEVYGSGSEEEEEEDEEEAEEKGGLNTDSAAHHHHHHEELLDDADASSEGYDSDEGEDEDEDGEIRSSADSEETVHQKVNGINGGIEWGADYDDAVLDDSQYNTAEDYD